MINYNSVDTGTIIYMVETSTVLEFIILRKFTVNNVSKLKLKGADLIFEVELNDIASNSYLSEEEAMANSMKYIFNEVNVLIKSLSDEDIKDYIDLDVKLKKYRELFPEIFI